MPLEIANGNQVDDLFSTVLVGIRVCSIYPKFRSKSMLENFSHFSGERHTFQFSELSNRQLQKTFISRILYQKINFLFINHVLIWIFSQGKITFLA